MIIATFMTTGHAKNVANFEQLTSFITGLGATYNPSKSSIKLATRIMNAIIATDTTPEVDKNAKILIRKIQGKRAEAKNTAVVTTLVPLSNTRITRNDLMYKANKRMVDIALDSKVSVKSAFGATSPQYKQVSKLKFTTPR